MKRLAALTVLIVFTVISCNLAPIEEVQVKGDPVLTIPSGTASMNLSDLIDIEEMLKGEDDDGDDSGLQLKVEKGVTEDGKPYSKIVVNQEIFSFDLEGFEDFAEFLDLKSLDFGDIDFGDFDIPKIEYDVEFADGDFSFDDFTDFSDMFDLGDITIDIDDFDGIEIPEIQEDNIDLNIASEFDISDLSGVEIDDTSIELTIPEPGVGNEIDFSELGGLGFEIEFGDKFSFITFEEAILELELDIKENTGLVITITEAYITDEEDTFQINAAIPVDGLELDGNAAKKLEFELDGERLPNAVQVVFEGTISGGTQGNDNALEITPALADGYSIEKVEGIDISDEPKSPDAPIAFPGDIFPDKLVSAVIEEGSITIVLTIPDDWENITIGDDTEFILLQDETVQFPSELQEDGRTFIIDLENLEINNDPLNLTLDYTIVISGSDAAITTEEIGVAVGIEVAEFRELTVKETGLDEKQEFTFDAGFLDYVTHITFVGDDPQLSITLNNQLPFSLELVLESILLKDGTATLLFPAGEQTVDTADLEKSVDLKTLVPIGGDVNLLSIKPQPEGYQPDGTFTMNNVRLGDEYSLGVQDVSLADIESVTIDITQTALGNDAIEISFEADDLPDELKSAKIGEGELVITITLPDNWSGVDLEGTEFTLKDGNGFDKTSTRDEKTFTIDLKDLEISGDGTDLTFEYTFNIAGDIPPDADGDIEFSASISVTELSEIVLEMDGLEITEEIKLDAEIFDFLSTVTFKDDDPKLTFTVNNQLPFNLNLTLISEVLFNEVDGKAEFTFDRDQESSKDASLHKEVDFSVLKGTGDQDGKVVLLTIEALPEGYVGNQLTLTDVKLGEKFSLDFEIAIDEIKSVTLDDISFTSDDLSEEDEFSIDLSDINDVLFEGISIDEVIALMNFAGVDAFEGHIILIAKYTDSNDEQVILPLAGTPDDPDNPEFDLEKYEPDEFSPGTPLKLHLEQLINDRAGNVEFAFSITVDGFVVELDDTPENLLVDLGITIPLLFTVETAEGVLLELDDDEPLLPVGEDLLGREDEDDDMNEILSQLGHVALKFNLVNDVGIRPEIRLSHSNGDENFYKVIDFETGSQELDLDSDDIAYIINTFPFDPKMEIYLKEGKHRIDHEGELELGVLLTVGLDIDYTIPLFK